MKKKLYDLRIKKLEIQSYNCLKITLTNDSEYTANLSSEFSQLFCYPKNFDEWMKAKINDGAYAIEWKCGFDIHFDQIIGLSLQQGVAS